MRILFVCLLLLLPVAASVAPGQVLDITVDVHKDRNRGDDPMIVFYLEDSQGNFIRTLQMFGRDKKYYKDLKEWKAGSRQEPQEDVDAVVSATIVWNSSGHYRVPTQIGTRDLLDGNYVIRVESGRDRAGLLSPPFRIPLPKGFDGGTFQNAGYASVVTIKVVPQ